MLCVLIVEGMSVVVNVMLSNEFILIKPIKAKNLYVGTITDHLFNSLLRNIG